MERKSGFDTGALAFLFLGLLFGLGFGWFVFPQLLYSEVRQPIPFNHKTHIENAGMSCEDCHKFRDDGSFAGYPDTAQCGECHADTTGGDTPGEKAIDKLVTEYVQPGKEVEWQTYQYQPDNVFFTHSAHQAFECTQCHPDIGNSATAPVLYRDRLTGYSKTTMKMDRCERCHAENGVSNACYVCHK
ncbi:Cytochrome c, class III, conserved region [Desulfovibrio sp. X2]|uniref:menaquinone reductase multiheme cytochrome c subunit QrcA n=1 Tax=Desulfovibrio sp. X2 TaxID=941449 RepID=UPI000358905F|nr:menaquinone reductase multiheme cytochrome c subunit QrcA [Desulfovibrio sp. X2]EPR41728.1 Cytochrome c, class III, conserved region [Desulfovibrio sp. X2]